MFLRQGGDGWYCATKDKMFFPLEGFCWSASFLFSKCISERVRVIKFCGYPLSLRFFWNSFSQFWKFCFEEFVLSNRRASPFIKPFLTPNGWQDVKCVYWIVSVGLNCRALTSRIDILLDRFPLYTIVSRNVTLFSAVASWLRHLGGNRFVFEIGCFVFEIWVLRASVFVFETTIRRVVFVEVFICFTDNINALVLWYICVKTCDVHRNKKCFFFSPLCFQ